jgi:hypothetical protein
VNAEMRLPGAVFCVKDHALVFFRVSRSGMPIPVKFAFCFFFSPP